MLENKNMNMVRGKQSVCFLLFVFMLTVVCSCKEKKEPEEIVVDKVIDKPRTDTEVMQDETMTGEVTWIGGGNYSYSISRTSDESLPKVTNHDIPYYDNSIQLVVKRADGSVFFDKSFTKQSFGETLPEQFRKDGVLLGMNFEEVSGNVLKFVVSIGSPDDSYDEYYHILVTVNNYGSTSYGVYKAKR